MLFVAYQSKVGLLFKAHQLQSFPAFPGVAQPNVHALAFSHDAGKHRWHQQLGILSLLNMQDLA